MLLLPQIEEIEPGVFDVPSLSKEDDSYTVHWHGIGGRCECKGYRHRQWCIHLEAVKIKAGQ